MFKPNPQDDGMIFKGKATGGNEVVRVSLPTWAQEKNQLGVEWWYFFSLCILSLCVCVHPQEGPKYPGL